MLRAVLIAGAVISLLYFLRVVLMGSAPRRSGLSPNDLSRYARYLATALAGQGRVEVGSTHLPGPVLLEKREEGGVRFELVMRLLRSSFGRRRLARAATALEDAGVPHLLHRSPRLHLLDDISVSLDTSSPRVVNSGATAVRDALAALGVPDHARLTVVCRGPFRPGFPPEDGEVLTLPLSYRLGFALGRALGAIAHLLHDREE